MATAHSSADSRAREHRKIPAQQSLQRSRVVVSAATAAVAGIGLTPLLVALLGVQADGLAFGLGCAAGLGTIGVRALSNARRKRRLPSQSEPVMAEWTYSWAPH